MRWPLFSKTRPVPSIRRGTMGTPAFMASFMLPLLNSAIWPVWLRVPSGKMTMDRPWRICLIAWLNVLAAWRTSWRSKYRQPTWPMRLLMIGILANSFFAMKAIGLSTCPKRSMTSKMPRWLPIKTTGPEGTFSSPRTVTLLPVAFRTTFPHQWAYLYTQRR